MIFQIRRRRFISGEMEDEDPWENVEPAGIVDSDISQLGEFKIPDED